jgi:hypothetical protein
MTVIATTSFLITIQGTNLILNKDCRITQRRRDAQ